MKCSCGNPLGAFEHDADSADVTFTGKSKRWKAYNRKKVVKIEPVVKERPVTTYELVDIGEENAGLARRAGTDGAQDKPLPDDPGAEKLAVRVPAVVGMPAQQATQILEDQGFRVQAHAGPSGSADPGTVLGQDPAADEQVSHGGTVTLTVAPGLAPTGAESQPSDLPDATPTEGSGAAVVPALTDEPVPEPLVHQS